MAENSGGPHTLKYGVTTNHVLGLEVVLPNGEIMHFGGQPSTRLVTISPDSSQALKARLALSRRSPCAAAQTRGLENLLAVFASVAEASAVDSGIIETGLIPAAIEMMDNSPSRPWKLPLAQACRWMLGRSCSLNSMALSTA